MLQGRDAQRLRTVYTGDLRAHGRKASLFEHALLDNPTEKDRAGSVQLARSSRASISSRSKAKSMGLVNKPSAPLSIALRLVWELP